MKSIITLAIVASAFAVASAAPRPDLVERVNKGELAEARVSWWGFDRTDSTRFIKAALASKAKKVVFDRMEGPWYSTPQMVRGRDGLHVSFERGAELVALRGFFTNRVDALLTFSNVKNLRLSGYGASIRMWRCDYARPPYCWSEWRHAVTFMNVENATVEGLRIEESGGDGLYLNGVKDCVVRDVICDRNYRQGISVISAENLLIENCTLCNTKGTPPAAGIDFEPNNMAESLVNCVMRNCTIADNEGAGIDMALVCLNGKSKDVSLRFENCRVIGNRQGLRLGSENPPLNELKGTIDLRNCLFDRSQSGIVLNENDGMPIKINLDGCVLRTVGKDGALVETAMDGAWLDKAFPNKDAVKMPDVKRVSDRALDRAEIHDSTPGQMAALSTLLIRGAGRFVFHAAKAGPVRFTARQIRLGARGRLSTKVVPVLDGRGKTVAHVKMAEIGDKESPFAVDVPAAGFYFFKAGASGALFTLMSSEAPVALDVTESHANFNSGVGGSLYLPVPEGCDKFVFSVAGSFPGEAVQAAICDPSGKEVWREAGLVRWRAWVSPDKPMPGVWSFSLTRSPGRTFDDYKCEMVGLPGFLFLSPKKYWCAPVARR